METRKTKLYSFELMLTGKSNSEVLFEPGEFLDVVEERLFEVFEGDVTPVTVSGIPVLYCSIEGESVEDAVNKVALHVVQIGLHREQLVMKLGAEGFQTV